MENISNVLTMLIDFLINFHQLQSLLLTFEAFGRLAITSELSLANISDCAFNLYYFEENKLVGGILISGGVTASVIWHLKHYFG